MTARPARSHPQALDPAIVRLIEALARAQARREDRRDRLVGQEPQQAEHDDIGNR